MGWTEEQNKAIKALERAFKRCAKVKVGLYGCDDSVIAVPSGLIDFEEFGRKKMGVGDIAKMDEAKYVNTHGAYIDSGGA